MSAPYAKEYRDQTVEISRLVVGSGWILEGVTFVNCEVIGPAILLPMQTTFTHCGFDSPDFDSTVYVVSDEREIFTGVIAVRNCVFSGCQIRGIGLVLHQSHVESVRGGMGG